MYRNKDILLTVDYHAKNTEIRWLDCHTGEERRLNIPTTREEILRLVEKAQAEADRVGGEVIWIMESTTGWARVRELIGSRTRFILANVLQMPLPPKAYRRKSDKIDTGRIQREFLNGSLPLSYQPTAWWREVRRLVDSRQDLVERQTVVKNWITHFLHHETWVNRSGLTVEEIATELKISKSIVYRLIRSGELEAVDIVDNQGRIDRKGHYRVRRISLNQYLESKKVKLLPGKTPRIPHRNNIPKAKKDYLGL